MTSYGKAQAKPKQPMKRDNARPRAARRATSVSIDVVVLNEAHRLGLNISRELEEHLTRMITAEHKRLWLESADEHIRAFNEHIEKKNDADEGSQR